MIVMKSDGAFLTIGELSAELGVPQHILRYWESRFSQLRPLQRSGNRRYYRPADVALARRIHQLLNVEGFTVRGAQKLLMTSEDAAPDVMETPPPAQPSEPASSDVTLIARLQAIRDTLAAAL